MKTGQNYERECEQIKLPVQKINNQESLISALLYMFSQGSTGEYLLDCTGNGQKKEEHLLFRNYRYISISQLFLLSFKESSIFIFIVIDIFLYNNVI
ncbi:hypothetical protein MSHOH_0552 [Methanosarcina horonobensis HB-1 = JCM 15518]|uniref:Uncharacterized protein n=1 Tax=Methanosarcina horonobensis HB-1 = JCM 15518 TaxID=1434110 RepID=A0A0E3WSN8_9EURY|nr:hypothetical protein MSHOH_0552 [Methanosarcina horonobensis HB-1 = JCM 15518]